MRVSALAPGWLLALSACSLGLATASSPISPEREPDCTSSRTRPTADLIAAPAIAVVGAIASFVVALPCADSNSEQDCDVPNLPTLGIGLATAVAFAASGAWGLSKVRQFERARQSHFEWLEAGSPNDPAAHSEVETKRRDAQSRERCAAWKRELGAASSESAKLAAVKRRPANC